MKSFFSYDRFNTFPKCIQSIMERSKMKAIVISIVVPFITTIESFAQTPLQFDYTGSYQEYTVSPCQTSIDVIVAGAKGGGLNGGAGAGVSATLPVTPGQVLRIYIGGEGTCPAAGWNGGGPGRSADNAGNTSCGGGGSTDIRVAPYGLANRIIVAGGGGGMGGGTSDALGGSGGCGAGVIGASPNGFGGQGGTQVAGGSGGAPYQVTGMAGANGVIGTGGFGGKDLCFNLAPGGGGGGGFYGGGGGGSDCFATLPNGGGGGGGGSSFVPVGGICFTASNNGPGYVQITDPEITAYNSGPYCAGGTIQLLAANGATSYSWTGPNFFSSNLQNPIIPNCTVANNGVYTLVITGTSCNLPLNTTVTVTSTPATFAGYDDTICFGSPFQLSPTLYQASNQRIWTNATTGISPAPTVTFSPSPSVPNPSVIVSSPGMYTFALAETTSTCGVLHDTIRIVFTDITASATTSSPSCVGMADGTIQINGAGATEYSFDNGVTWSPINTQSTYTAGTYNVCARDANSCSDCVAAVVTNPNPVQMTVSNDTTICENGTATLIASSVGGELLDFTWLQIPTGVNYQTTNAQSVAVNGWYSVYGENANGCQTLTDSIFVDYFPSLTGTISPDQVVCPGKMVNLQAGGTGGIGGPYNFAWSNGSSGSGITDNINVYPTALTNYSVTISDNCETTPIVLNSVVTMSTAPVAAFSSPSTEQCELATFDLSITTDPSTFVSSQWSISDGQKYQNMNSLTTGAMPFGSYDVELILQNGIGCTDTTMVPNFLISHPKPISNFSYSPEKPTTINPEINFINFSTNSVNSSWVFDQGSPAVSTDENPIVLFNNGLTGVYNVSLTSTSDFGCVDSFQGVVEVVNDILLYAPNAFTPDDNKYNSTWKIYIEGIDKSTFELKIFDRWGKVVWVSNDPEVEWDGTFENRLLPVGSYNWQIHAIDAVTDEPYFYKGNVMLIK